MFARRLSKARQHPALPGKAQSEISHLSRKVHPSLVVLRPACYWSNVVVSPSSADIWMGDDVAPTSLNEGRGELVPALAIVFHMGLKHCLADGWSGGGGTSRRASSPNVGVPNAERQKGAILGQAAGFPVVSSRCRSAEDKPCSGGNGDMCI